MKFSIASLLALLVVGVGAKAVPHELVLNNIKADSPMGMKLLSQARRLENNNYNSYSTTYDNTWISGFSLKFQGCHHISQWNDEANANEDVRIATKRLVRFRLCPSDYCSASSSKGCSEGYGDYILDMNTFLQAYFEAKQTYKSFSCDSLSANCGCDNANQNGGNNNQNNNYSKDMCLYDCYAAHGMEGFCMDYNPYAEDQQKNEFNLENYMECGEASFQNQNADNANGDWNGKYYIGPFCSGQGLGVHLGVFTDDSCTTFADNSGGRETYYYNIGSDLPYSNSNIIDMDCLSCKEPTENNVDGNDADDTDDVADACENIYTMAGKCENSLPYGTVVTPNNNACNYMEGIKIVRKDGTVVTSENKANKTASVFIGIFVVAFVLLSAYVYYLKTKLDRASINLAD